MGPAIPRFRRLGVVAGTAQGLKILQFEGGTSIEQLDPMVDVGRRLAAPAAGETVARKHGFPESPPLSGQARVRLEPARSLPRTKDAGARGEARSVVLSPDGKRGLMTPTHDFLANFSVHPASR